MLWLSHISPLWKFKDQPSLRSTCRELPRTNKNQKDDSRPKISCLGPARQAPTICTFSWLQQVHLAAVPSFSAKQYTNPGRPLSLPLAWPQALTLPPGQISFICVSPCPSLDRNVLCDLPASHILPFFYISFLLTKKYRFSHTFGIWGFILSFHQLSDPIHALPYTSAIFVRLFPCLTKRGRIQFDLN